MEGNKGTCTSCGMTDVELNDKGMCANCAAKDENMGGDKMEKM